LPIPHCALTRREVFLRNLSLPINGQCVMGDGQCEMGQFIFARGEYEIAEKF
jgi:hypothetical protein